MEYWKELMHDGCVTLFWDHSIYEENIKTVRLEGLDIYIPLNVLNERRTTITKN